MALIFNSKRNKKWLRKSKKETLKIELDYKQVKPQNLAAMALTNFSGGTHQKSNKSKRQKAKMSLKRELSSSYVGEFFICFKNIFNI